MKGHNPGVGKKASREGPKTQHQSSMWGIEFRCQECNAVQRQVNVGFWGREQNNNQILEGGKCNPAGVEQGHKKSRKYKVGSFRGDGNLLIPSQLPHKKTMRTIFENLRIFKTNIRISQMEANIRISEY